MKYVISTVIALTQALVSGVAYAAEIYPDIRGSYAAIVIEGEIQSGDYDAFIELVEAGQGRFSTVALMSSGGDFEEAIKIGRALRALELSTLVPSFNDQGGPNCSFTEPREQRNCTCSSACFFIHMGSVGRSGLYLGVHRPYFDPALFGQLSRTDARSAFARLQDTARVYLTEMEVPTEVQEKLFSTPSDDILVLDEDTVRTHFLGTLPYLDEWTRGRCAILSSDKVALEESLSNKFRAQTLSEGELSTLTELRDLQRQERNCRIREQRILRDEAFEVFFGEAPADYKGHDFAAWHQIALLLGSPFHALERQGFVRQPDSIGSSSLQRKAFTSEPLVTATDVGAERGGVVATILVHGPPNPSDQFNSLLLEALIKTWGDAGIVEIVEDERVWRWVTEGFRAELKVDGPRDDRYVLLTLKD